MTHPDLSYELYRYVDGQWHRIERSTELARLKRYRDQWNKPEEYKLVRVTREEIEE